MGIANRNCSGPSAPIQSGRQDKLKPLGFGAVYVVVLRSCRRQALRMDQSHGPQRFPSFHTRLVAASG
jgi:hypothetical protein